MKNITDTTLIWQIRKQQSGLNILWQKWRRSSGNYHWRKTFQ